MRVKKSKKAVSFSLILTPLMVILLFVYSTSTTAIEDIPSKIEFGEQTKEVSLISNNIISHDFYLERFSDIFVQLSRENFLPAYLGTCIELGKVYFYDQSKNRSCMTSLNITVAEFEKEFLLTYQQEFYKYESLLNSEHHDISFTSNIEDSSIIVETDFSRESFSLTKKKEFSIDLAKELMIVQQLQENINEVTTNLQEELTLCTSNPIFSKKACVESIVGEYLKKDLDEISIDVLYTEKEQYYELEIDLYDTAIEKDLFSFAMKFEDISPFYHIDFSFEEYALQNDMIRVTIERPKNFEKPLYGYILLYSYDNFFDPTYEGYEQLIELLSQRDKIPGDFIGSTTPYLDTSAIEMKHSKSSDSFDISLLFIPVKDTRNLEETVILHQIYNGDTQRYSLLNTGDTLYGYVFAVDTSFTYYIDENHFSTGIESVVIKKALPPFPMEELFFKESQIPELTSGFAFTLSGYQDDSFNSYDMIVCTTTVFRQSDLSSCETLQSPSFQTTQGEYILYDSNQQNSLDAYQSYTKIPLTTTLEENQEYYLYILPKNSQGEFIFNKKNLPYKLNDKGSYFEFSKYSSVTSDSLLSPFVVKFTK